MSEPEFFTRADGTVDAGWMQEHYDWAQGLPPEFRESAVAHLDAVWNRANTDALAENETRAELVKLLRPYLAAAPETPAPAVSPSAPQTATGAAEHPAAPVARTVTPDRNNPDGSITVKVQRCCNGCGDPLGDVTLSEIDCAIIGAPLPDVRAECPRCSTSTAGGAS